MMRLKWYADPQTLLTYMYLLFKLSGIECCIWLNGFGQVTNFYGSLLTLKSVVFISIIKPVWNTSVITQKHFHCHFYVAV